MNTSVADSPLVQGIILEAKQTLPLLLTQASAEVLLIWDIIITFDREVELIWRAPKSIVKYLFFFIRYASLSIIIFELVSTFGLFTSTINICLIGSRWEIIVSSFVLWSVDLLLLYRVYAFYGKNIKMIYTLLALWILNIGAITVFAILIYLKYPIMHVTTDLLPGILAECIVTSFPEFLPEIWICELVFQSILFFLVMLRFIKLQITNWNKNRGISGVYLVFIRDGIWAYGVLFVVFFGSAVEHRLTGISWIIWTVSLVEITTTRLILNLRDVGHHPESTNNYSETSTLTNSPRWMQRAPIAFDTIDESKDGDEVTLGDVIELSVLRENRRSSMEVPT